VLKLFKSVNVSIEPDAVR